MAIICQVENIKESLLIGRGFVQNVIELLTKTIDAKNINTHQKGQYYERKVKKILEADGYVVFKPVWSLYGKKDIFGADLLGYNPVTKHLVFAQVKANANDLSKAIKVFREVMPKVSRVSQQTWFGGTLNHEENLIIEKIDIKNG